MIFRKICAGIVRDCFLGKNTQQHDCARSQTSTYQKLLFLRYNSIPVGIFPRRVSMVILIYNQKSFVRRRLYRCRLRHKIYAIKTRPNNPLRFLQCKNSIRRYLANDLTCAARKTTFRTRKRCHNKQYTPKSKDQPLESDRTHFYIGFNNGNVAMHRPTIIFLLSHKITTVQ